MLAAVALAASGSDKNEKAYIRADLFNLDAIAEVEKIPEEVRSQTKIAMDSVSTFSYDRSGSASETHQCDQVTGVPPRLTWITNKMSGGRRFYYKYTHAYNIPIVSSNQVSDKALKKACYIMRFLFADRADVRNMMYKKWGRFAVIGTREYTTTIPEFSNLPNWWNTRARGLGGTLQNPISTGGEENLLCLQSDRYFGDDIFFHESAHSVAEVALYAGAIPGMYRRIGALHRAVKNRLWRGTYSYTDQREYFAEALQSFHNCHTSKLQPGVHNHINTRAELRTYDYGMYKILKEIYPCMNTYHWCGNPGTSPMRMNCDGSQPVTTPPNPTDPPTVPPTQPPTQPPPKPTTSKPTTSKPSKCSGNVTDKNTNCGAWASAGFCKQGSRYTPYMFSNCKESCKCCVNRSKKCDTWANKGFCEGHSGYMNLNCRKACNYCSIGANADYSAPPL